MGNTLRDDGNEIHQEASDALETDQSRERASALYRAMADRRGELRGCVPPVWYQSQERLQAAEALSILRLGRAGRLESSAT